MNLSLSTLTCPDWPLERIIAAAQAHHLRAIEFRGLGAEIDITKLMAFTVNVAKTLEQFRQAKLKIACFSTSVTLLSPVGDRWEAMIEECHRYAILAGEVAAGDVGSPHIRVFGGRAPAELSRAEALSLARRRIRQVVKICQPRRCIPLVETHDDWSASADVLELMEGLEPEEAAVLWDVEHPFRRGEKPRDTAVRLGRYLAHVHWKDSTRIDGRSRPELMGRGDLPLAECREALEHVAYSGWISQETEKRWHADAPEPDQAIADFAAFMRQRRPS